MKGGSGDLVEPIWPLVGIAAARRRRASGTSGGAEASAISSAGGNPSPSGPSSATAPASAAVEIPYSIPSAAPQVVSEADWYPTEEVVVPDWSGSEVGARMQRTTDYTEFLASLEATKTTDRESGKSDTWMALDGTTYAVGDIVEMRPFNAPWKMGIVRGIPDSSPGELTDLKISSMTRRHEEPRATEGAFHWEAVRKEKRFQPTHDKDDDKACSHTEGSYNISEAPPLKVNACCSVTEQLVDWTFTN
jgi:hypothetical protein